MKIFNVYSYPKVGDHIVSYGIIKEFAKIHDIIHYWSDYQPDNMFETNKRLFSGIKNVELIREPYDESVLVAEHCIAHTKFWFNTMRPIINNPIATLPEWFNESWIFDRQWYFNANFPINFKWENFDFVRDLKKEREVYYDILDLKDGEEFILLSEDPLRNYYIDRNYINPNIKPAGFTGTLPPRLQQPAPVMPRPVPQVMPRQPTPRPVPQVMPRGLAGLRGRR